MNERIGKRLLSALLSVVMLLSLLPTMAFAEGEESAGAATTATRITDVSTLKVDDQIVIANAAAGMRSARIRKPTTARPWWSQPPGAASP